MQGRFTQLFLKHLFSNIKLLLATQEKVTVAYCPQINLTYAMFGEIKCQKSKLELMVQEELEELF